MNEPPTTLDPAAIEQVGNNLIVKATNGDTLVMGSRGEWFRLQDGACSCPEFERFGSCTHTDLVGGAQPAPLPRSRRVTTRAAAPSPRRTAQRPVANNTALLALCDFLDLVCDLIDPPKK